MKVAFECQRPYYMHFALQCMCRLCTTHCHSTHATKHSWSKILFVISLCNWYLLDCIPSISSLWAPNIADFPFCFRSCIACFKQLSFSSTWDWPFSSPNSLMAKWSSVQLLLYDSAEHYTISCLLGSIFPAAGILWCLWSCQTWMSASIRPGL